MHSPSLVDFAAGAVGATGKVMGGLVVEDVGNSRVDSGNGSSRGRGVESTGNAVWQRADAAATVPPTAAAAAATASWPTSAAAEAFYPSASSSR